MHNLFDSPPKRFNTNSYKYDNLQPTYGRTDLIPLWVADMDFCVSPAISQAFAKRIQHNIFGYGLYPSSLYRAVINWHHKRFGVKITVDSFNFTPGVVPALGAAVLAFTNVGDSVLVQPPVYNQFYRVVSNNQRKLVYSPLLQVNNSYQMDFDNLEQNFAAGVKLMLLCSPHNPVGRVWSKTELTTLLTLANRYGVVVVADEIHADIIYQGSVHTPLTALTQLNHNCVVVWAASKTFGLGGLKSGQAWFGNPQLQQKWQNTMLGLGLGHINAFAVPAVEAAYMDSEEWYTQLMLCLQGNRDLLLSRLQTDLHKIKVAPLQGSYVAWLDFSSLSLSQQMQFDLLVNKAQLALSAGVEFGPGGANCWRLNFACPRALLKQALNQLANALEEI